MLSRSIQRRLGLRGPNKKEFMGKVLEFKKNPPAEGVPLTEEEIQACKVAKVLRESFTDEQVEAMRKDLENED